MSNIRLSGKDFRLRPSQAQKVMAGSMSLSATDQAKIDLVDAKLAEGKSPTPKQNNDYLEAKAKAELLKKTLPKGAKSVANAWIREVLIYNRKLEISNKYTRKGKKNEDLAIEELNLYLGTNFKKNTKRIEDDYFTGECDIDSEIYDMIIDIKNSYSLDTFPIHDEVLVNEDYIAQVRVYMELYKRSRGAVSYHLTDLPDEDVEAIAYGVMKERGMDELDFELFEEIKALHTYSDLDEFARIKIFGVDPDDKWMDELKYRVDLMKIYIDEEMERILNYEVQQRAYFLLNPLL